MKKKLLIISLALVMVFGIQYRNRAEAHTTVSFNIFFDALAPYGNWTSVPTYGYAWHPTGVGPYWRPYTDGRWLWSDYGWTWISYEPWGWATYHYGRWVFLDYYGWVWIPGTVWAPAWVTWYTSPGYIGWAPLPPDDYFFSRIGIGFDYYDYPDYDYHHHHHYISTRHCVFVPSSYFLYDNLRSVIVPPSQNIMIIKNTTNITNIKLVNNKIVNYGPSVSLVEKRTGARVQKINIVEERDLAVLKRDASVNRLEGKNYHVFRPNIVKKGNETPLIRGRSRNSVQKIKDSDNRVLNQDDFENSPNQEHSIGLDNKKRDLSRIKHEDARFYNQNNLDDLTDLTHPIKGYDRKTRNSPASKNVRSQMDIYSEAQYTAHKNTQKEFSKYPTRSVGNLKQRQKRDEDFYSYTQTPKRTTYYKAGLDTGGQELQKRGFIQNSEINKGNSSSYKYSKQKNRF
jgi:hypothetical protein